MNALLYRKFIRDNMYPVLSESTGYCRRYDKNILVCFFVSQCTCFYMSGGMINRKNDVCKYENCEHIIPLCSLLNYTVKLHSFICMLTSLFFYVSTVKVKYSHTQLLRVLGPQLILVSLQSAHR